MQTHNLIYILVYMIILGAHNVTVTSCHSNILYVATTTCMTNYIEIRVILAIYFNNLMFAVCVHLHDI